MTASGDGREEAAGADTATTRVAVRADNADIARIAAALAPLGIAVEISGSAPELGALARSGDVDAIILDADLAGAWPTDAAIRVSRGT